MKPYLGLVVAGSLLLTACGGGGGGGGGGPVATNQLPEDTEQFRITSEPSKLIFEWADVEVEEDESVCYQLLVNADGDSGFTALKVADDGDDSVDTDAEYCTEDTQFEIANSTLDTHWSGARYMLSSCVDSETDCNTVTTRELTTEHMQDSIETILNPYWQDIVDVGPIINGSQYGGEMAMSADGNTLAIGSTSDSSYSSLINAGHTNILFDPATGGVDNSRVGAVYVFKKINNQWQLDGYLKASTNSPPLTDDYYNCFCGFGNLFGSSIDISDDGNRIIVGAMLHSYSAEQRAAGAAYVYDRTGGQWQETQIIETATRAHLRNYGIFVRISGIGDSIVVISDPLEPGLNPSVAEHFLIENDQWVLKNDISLGLSIRSFDMSQDGTTLAFSSGIGFGISNYDNGEWTTTILQSPASSRSQGLVELSEDGKTLIMSDREDDRSDVPGISIFTFNGTEWLYDQTLYAAIPHPDSYSRAKINNAGDKIYAANFGMASSHDIAEGIYKTDNFLALVAALESTIPGELSSFIHVFSNINGEWEETDIIYNYEFEQWVSQSRTKYLTNNDNLIYLDLMDSGEGKPRDVIKIY
ncbi:hypothetical protein A9Q99_13820 [Gammaproteobacteria bacterium 45_16_T64]|nr:hypothetical protein A9Q99_13820 [Gammaproteobacteria bacterium 45_16_T64]